MIVVVTWLCMWLFCACFNQQTSRWSLNASSSSCSSRWLVPRGSSLRTLLPPITVAETTFALRHVPDTGGGGSSSAGPGAERPEPSEAECDIDSLKKLKLGLRSSLWSRPGGSNLTHGDYSIAVWNKPIVQTSTKNIHSTSLCVQNGKLLSK